MYRKMGFRFSLVYRQKKSILSRCISGIYILFSGVNTPSGIHWERLLFARICIANLNFISQITSVMKRFVRFIIKLLQEVVY